MRERSLEVDLRLEAEYSLSLWRLLLSLAFVQVAWPPGCGLDFLKAMTQRKKSGLVL
jgi:hypothetical protein